MQLAEAQQDLLRELARKYIWWKTPEDAPAYPQRILAQVMNIGDWGDARLMLDQFTPETLREVLLDAEAGQLNARSCHFWHYRLGLATLGQVPPLPGRRTA